MLRSPVNLLHSLVPSHLPLLSFAGSTFTLAGSSFLSSPIVFESLQPPAGEGRQIQWLCLGKSRCNFPYHIHRSSKIEGLQPLLVWVWLLSRKEGAGARGQHRWPARWTRRQRGERVASVGWGGTKARWTRRERHDEHAACATEHEEQSCESRGGPGSRRACNRRGGRHAIVGDHTKSGGRRTARLLRATGVPRSLHRLCLRRRARSPLRAAARRHSRVPLGPRRRLLRTLVRLTGLVATFGNATSECCAWRLVPWRHPSLAATFPCSQWPPARRALCPRRPPCWPRARHASPTRSLCRPPRWWSALAASHVCDDGGRSPCSPPRQPRALAACRARDSRLLAVPCPHTGRPLATLRHALAVHAHRVGCEAWATPAAHARSAAPPARRERLRPRTLAALLHMPPMGRSKEEAQTSSKKSRTAGDRSPGLPALVNWWHGAGGWNNAARGDGVLQRHGARCS